MTDFSEISADDDREIEDVLRIYADSFPVNERHSVEVMHERVRRGRYRVFVGRARGEVVLFALLRPFKNNPFVLLDYMATKKEHRSRGIGSEFIGQIVQSAELAGKFLIIEVEDPRLGEDQAQRARRVQFYRRLGAREFQGVRYFMPGLSGGAPVKMILMVLPSYGNGEIDAGTVRRIIADIYGEVYDRGTEDELLKSIVNEITGKVHIV